MIDDLALAYRLLGEIYAKEHREGDAADMLRRYLAHYPGQAEAMELLSRLESLPAADAGAMEMAPSKGDVAPSEDEPAISLVDFATPTIAELYYSQGRVDAAIKTYEKVLDTDPNDPKILKRLDELRGMMTGEPPVDTDRPGVGTRAQTEQLIVTLERWLSKIREMRHA
jgi:tetratricopeptide (TPR) repeat protein